MKNKNALKEGRTFYTIMPYSNGNLYRDRKSAFDSQFQFFCAVLEGREDGDEGIDLLLYLHSKLPFEGLMEI